MERYFAFPGFMKVVVDEISIGPSETSQTDMTA